MSLKNIIQNSKKFLSHPLGRGMLSYSITWPTACIIQQLFDKKSLDEINWKTCMRYALYGTFFTAPTLYCWVRIATKLFPQKTVVSAIKKAALEQITYNPFSTSSFFFVMTYVETFNFDKAREEIRSKFWDTYKIGVCYWLSVQTINFAVIPERNRLVFVSFCGLLWILFLAYSKEHGNQLQPILNKFKSEVPSEEPSEKPSE